MTSLMLLAVWIELAYFIKFTMTGITGHLYDHMILSFLSGRTARIKIGDLIGDWLDSELGTSAGTRLGPLLFIMHLHDIPKCMRPTFADHLVAVSVANNFSGIESELQDATNQLVQWARMKVW